MFASKFAAVAIVGLTLAACAGSPDGVGPGPKENTGTLVGAGTGALIGAAVAGGGTGNRLAGAAIGGVLGGLIGNRIGAALDDEDKERAYAAQMDALERGQSGAPVSWRNPDLAATVRSFPAPPISRPAAIAVPSPTPSILMASRILPVARLAAIRNAGPARGLAHAGEADRSFRQSQISTGVRFCAKVFGGTMPLCWFGRRSDEEPPMKPHA